LCRKGRVSKIKLRDIFKNTSPLRGVFDERFLDEKEIAFWLRKVFIIPKSAAADFGIMGLYICEIQKIKNFICGNEEMCGGQQLFLKDGIQLSNSHWLKCLPRSFRAKRRHATGGGSEPIEEGG